LRRLALFALLSSALAACEAYVGPVPAPGELRFPVGVTVHPSGRWVYVLGSNFDGTYRIEDGGTVEVIDADTLSIVPDAGVSVASFGARLALGGDADAPDMLYAATRGDDSVVVLDVAEGGGVLRCRGERDTRACRVRDLPGDPYDVVEIEREPTLDRRTLAVASLSGELSVVDLFGPGAADAIVASRPLIAGTNHVLPLPGADELLVSGRFSNTLAAVSWYRDAADRIAAVVPLRTFSIVSPSPSSEVRDVLLSEDGATAWVVSSRPGGVQRFDVRRDDDGLVRGRYLDRFDLDGSPADAVLARENGRDVLYIVLAGRDALAVLDAETGAVLDRIAVGALPFGLAADTGERKRLYLTLFEEHAVAVVDIDPASRTFRSVVARIEAPQ
jgi:DNA-binding beta-propeller fold protein YncE